MMNPPTPTDDEITWLREGEPLGRILVIGGSAVFKFPDDKLIYEELTNTQVTFLVEKMLRTPSCVFNMKVRDNPVISQRQKNMSSEMQAGLGEEGLPDGAGEEDPLEDPPNDGQPDEEKEWKDHDGTTEDDFEPRREDDGV
jgi:hypothetical protein